MSPARFLIAKFTPDLRRMEPRNIGVVVWSDGAFAAKFSGEKTVGGKHVVQPPTHLHIESVNAYRQWVEYWRLMMSRTSIKTRDGTNVKRSDPEIVEALKSKSREQFTLAEGGQLLDRIRKTELSKVVKELFEELVERPTEYQSQHRKAAAKLRKACSRALKESGIEKRPDFRDKYPCTFHVGKAAEGFVFDYGLHLERPEAVLHKIAIWNADDAHSMAFRFQRVCEEHSLKKEQCASLVYLSKKDLSNKETKSRYELMREVGTVINLADLSVAERSLRRLAPSAKNTSTACLRHHGSRQPSFLRQLPADDSSGS